MAYYVFEDAKKPKTFHICKGEGNKTLCGAKVLPARMELWMWGYKGVNYHYCRKCSKLYREAQK